MSILRKWDLPLPNIAPHKFLVVPFSSTKGYLPVIGIWISGIVSVLEKIIATVNTGEWKLFAFDCKTITGLIFFHYLYFLPNQQNKPHLSLRSIFFAIFFQYYNIAFAHSICYFLWFNQGTFSSGVTLFSPIIIVCRVLSLHTIITYILTSFYKINWALLFSSFQFFYEY